MSACFWSFDCNAATEFKWRQGATDTVWLVEIDAASVGSTFSSCIRQDPGNKITSVLLAGIDDLARQYFGTTDGVSRAKKARKETPFLSTANGCAVATYRLWVFVRHESTLPTLQSAMAAWLTSAKDRHAWITACQLCRSAY